MPGPSQHGAVRFGVFELNIQAGELRKNGVKLKLQEQPFRVLTVLLEHAGEVVTREELKQWLWPDDTFVDFDNSLNTAVNKLREVLNDSASSPRFVETVPRRGYRFVAPVERIAEASQTLALRTPAALLPSIRPWQTAVIVLSALLIAAVSLILTLVRPSGAAREATVRTFTLSPPHQGFTHAVISPDGAHLAYVGEPDEHPQLWVWDLDQRQPRPILSTQGANGLLFWSPDSRFIGFAAGGELRKVAIGGSSPVVICRLPHAKEFLGGAWSGDGNLIVFAQEPDMYQVSAHGGVPEMLIDIEGGSEEHVEYPSFLPPNESSDLLLMRRHLGVHNVAVYSFKSGELRDINPLGNRWWPAYSPSGHILYAGSETPGKSYIQALPFSVTAMQATGDAFQIIENCNFPSVAGDGTLICSEDPWLRSRWQAVWRDRRGRELGNASLARFSTEGFGFTLSPEGERLATFQVGNPEIWVQHLKRDTHDRINSLSETARRSIWSPGGEAITFAGLRQGNYDIYSSAADGTGPVKLLVGTPLSEIPWDWSADGKFLLYVVDHPKTGQDIWYLQRTESGPYEPRVFLATGDNENLPNVTPDGRYVAYVSNKTGGSEVYIRTFPEATNEWRASNNRGWYPRWRKDGKELFYVQGVSIVAVSVTTEPELAIRGREVLFSSSGLYQEFDVSDDGNRFLLLESIGDTGDQADTRTIFRIVENWVAEFPDRRKEAQ